MDKSLELLKQILDLPKVPKATFGLLLSAVGLLILNRFLPLKHPMTVETALVTSIVVLGCSLLAGLIWGLCSDTVLAVRERKAKEITINLDSLPDDEGHLLLNAALNDQDLVFADSFPMVEVCESLRQRGYIQKDSEREAGNFYRIGPEVMFQIRKYTRKLKQKEIDAWKESFAQRQEQWKSDQRSRC